MRKLKFLGTEKSQLRFSVQQIIKRFVELKPHYITEENG